MARSLCFMAFAVLAMMLFVAYEVQAQTCFGTSNTFSGPCVTTEDRTRCKDACISEAFTDGDCIRLLPIKPCLCIKPCVSDEKKIKTGAETLVEEAKTFAAALLEKEIMNN